MNLSSGADIFVYTQPTDMRKGFNGLSGIVRGELQSDPTDGSLFIFINRREPLLDAAQPVQWNAVRTMIAVWTNPAKAA